MTIVGSELPTHAALGDRPYPTRAPTHLGHGEIIIERQQQGRKFTLP
jgi:hypothetical protein